MKITRVWAMPSGDTFGIKPIGEYIGKWMVKKNGGKVPSRGDLKMIDPFARNSPFKKLCLTNDIDETMETDYHLDALEFLKMQGSNEFDIVLFDPPYSPRQVAECYKGAGVKVNMETTQSSFWADMKNEIARITKPGGVVISFGWNSGGIGKAMGFEIREIMMVAHGGWHNDTIVVTEEKVQGEL